MENQPPSQQGFLQNQPTALPNATAVLVLGIVSIVTCICYGIPGVICSIIALVLAGKDMKLYNASPSSYTTGSLSNLKAGRVCAIIGLCLSLLFLIYIIFIIAVIGVAALSDPTHFMQNLK